VRRQLLLIALCAAAWCAYSGPILLVGSDSWWHIAQVEQLIQLGGLFPRGPAGELYPNTGIWYALLAAACRALGWTALQLWVLLPVLLAPVWVAVAAWAARQLLGPGWEARGAIAFLLLFEGTHLEPLRELGYPRYVNWIPLLIAIGAAVRYVDAGRPRDLALAACAGALTAVVHLLEFALFGLLLGFWGVVLLATGGERRVPRFGRAMLVGVATLALGLPYLRWVQGATPFLTAALDARLESDRFRELLRFGDHFFVLDPAGEFGATAGWLGLVAFLGAPLLARRARDSVADALLLAALAGPPLLVFNPLLLPLFCRLWPTPEVLHRLSLVMLVPFSALAVARAAWAGRASGARAVLIAALAVAALPVAARRAEALARPRWSDELAVVQPWAPAARFLRERYPASAVLLSDPLTGQTMSALGGHQIVERGTANEPDHDARARSLVGRLFRDPCQSSADALAALRAARVRAILINTRPGPRTHELAEHRDRWYAPGTRAVLASNPHAFRSVYASDGIEIYELLAGAAPPLAGKDVDPDVRRRDILVAAPAGPSGPEAGEGLRPRGEIAWRAARGGRLEASVDWELTRPGDTFLKVRFHFVHGAYGGGKLHRKLVERLEGRMHRTGADLDLVPEDYQVLPLRAGDVVRQRVSLAIPERYAPGDWEVRAEVRRKGSRPPRTVTLSDAPPGVAIGRLRLD
jgi:hypothetical protein